MAAHNAQYWIDKFQLIPHPEGGYFKQSYRSPEILKHHSMPERFSGDRPIATAIYYLLEGADFSAFHRIKANELWHFYAGSALEIISILPNSNIRKDYLGLNLDKKEQPQLLAHHSRWFGARVRGGEGYALCGCTLAPGFDFDDFELANRKELIRQFPQHERIITELTRI